MPSFGLRWHRFAAFLGAASLLGSVFVWQATGAEPAQGARTFADWVNPFIGTADHGHTFPGAALPGGLVQLGPDTDVTGWDWCSGYHYSDNSLIGFSHLHRSGMGAADWGDILVMPTVGALRVQPGSKKHPEEGYRSRFSHAEEQASPGYYAVNLKTYGIRAELTVAEHAGYHRYTFPKSAAAHVLIDLQHGIGDACTGAELKFTSDREVEGHRSSDGFVKGQDVYFCARFSKPFASHGIWNGQRVTAGMSEEAGRQIGAYVDFVTEEQEVIEVKVGISYTSTAQARRNLDTDLPDWDFASVRQAARVKWNKAMQSIEVVPGDADPGYRQTQLVTFYSALYHALLFPATFADADGTYVGLDGNTHGGESFTYRSDFSLWDTFRAEMPLLTLIAPRRTNDVICTMLRQYEQGGWLPTPQQFGNSYTNDMIGDHPVVVILDAYRKGVRDYDIQTAYQAVRKNATEVPPPGHRSKGRPGLESYLRLGYVPCDELNVSVSRTLEYAFNDWCVAQLAQDLGKREDFALFQGRAGNFCNVFDPETRFARPKDSGGAWLTHFDPTFVGQGKDQHYAEANAWQYTWFVPQDVQGLIRLMGGKDSFVERLDGLYSANSSMGSAVLDISGIIGQYAHGNEPGHHTIYLYDHAGQPWKTQRMVRRVVEELYHDGPDGICGNEDMGQMSAWYVFSTMGFYPATPGQAVYLIGSPSFAKVTIHFGQSAHDGSNFVVEARNWSRENFYIQSALLNGKSLDRPWLDHQQIRQGGTLVLTMGAQPNRKWGSAWEAAPPNGIDEK